LVFILKNKNLDVLWVQVWAQFFPSCYFDFDTFNLNFYIKLKSGFISFNNSTKYPVLIIELSSLKSPCLHPIFGPPFTPKTPLWVRSPKYGNFIRSGCEMLKLSI
jgi:hypothetical protein